ncbi:unnamed protein product, partial [Didymodactylos carnosus]
LHDGIGDGETFVQKILALLDQGNLCPLLYKFTRRNEIYWYITFSNKILLDFNVDDTKTSFGFMLATLVALFYTFDVQYPKTYKALFEILEHFMFNNTRKPSTVTAQNVIIEFNKKIKAV